jgi:NTP pyrophosphatase (non-canonical NTP hydrolase)
MTLNEYQEQSQETAFYPDRGNNVYYPAIGLAGEAGEVCNQIKKIMRDDHGNMTSPREAKLIDELGDVLWYVAALATELRIDLNSVAKINIEKLKFRQNNNSLKGDNR